MPLFASNLRLLLASCLAAVRELIPQYAFCYRWLFARKPQEEARKEGRYYVRTGGCNQCGECCQSLYLTFQRTLIQTPEAFETLQALHPQEYASFVIAGSGERGLVFNCKHLGVDLRCGAYEARPSFCHSYPTEEGLLNGGKLPSACSYRFEPKHSFRGVLSRLQQADSV